MTATVINEMNAQMQDPLLPALERVTRALAALLRLDDLSSPGSAHPRTIAHSLPGSCRSNPEQRATLRQ